MAKTDKLTLAANEDLFNEKTHSRFYFMSAGWMVFRRLSYHTAVFELRRAKRRDERNRISGNLHRQIT